MIVVSMQTSSVSRSFKMFVLYDFLHVMWQMQLFLAKVTLKCSYYFVCLLLKVGLSCRSLPGFFLSCFHVLSYSRSNILVSVPQPQPQSTRSRTTMPIKWGSNLRFCSCTIWWLHFCIWRPFCRWWSPKGNLEFF